MRTKQHHADEIQRRTEAQFGGSMWSDAVRKMLRAKRTGHAEPYNARRRTEKQSAQSDDDALRRRIESQTGGTWSAVSRKMLRYKRKCHIEAYNNRKKAEQQAAQSATTEGGSK
jgi:hypothetical protein